MASTILVVDDSKLVRMELRRVLEDLKYNVVEAKDGVEALEKTEKDMASVDLIVTDIVMPRKDGIQFIREIHERNPNWTGPIFALTAETNEELKAMGKELGIVLWITKPVNAMAIGPVVQKFLEKRAANSRR